MPISIILAQSASLSKYAHAGVEFVGISEADIQGISIAFMMSGVGVGDPQVMGYGFDALAAEVGTVARGLGLAADIVGGEAAAVEGAVGGGVAGGEMVTLYHGHQGPLVGGAFDLDVATALQRPGTPTPGIYLTDDLVRAATQYAGPRGFVTRTQIPASRAGAMMQASPIRGPGGAIQYEWVARTDQQVGLLNQSLQTLPQIQALRLWLGNP